MARNDSPHRRARPSCLLVSSYVSDWVLLAAVAVVANALGHITPNKRPFQLEDPDIS